MFIAMRAYAKMLKLMFVNKTILSTSCVIESLSKQYSFHIRQVDNKDIFSSCMNKTKDGRSSFNHGCSWEGG